MELEQILNQGVSWREVVRQTVIGMKRTSMKVVEHVNVRFYNISCQHYGMMSTTFPTELPTTWNDLPAKHPENFLWQWQT